MRDEFEDDTLLIQNKLGHLNSTWQLEETNIPCLLESIRVMQSRSNLLSSESAAMNNEIKSLLQSLSEAGKVNLECTKGSKIMIARLQQVTDTLQNTKLALA